MNVADAIMAGVFNKSGGTGGVTKAYVDEQVGNAVGTSNISSASTGTVIDITDSADARMQDMKIYGSASGIGSDGLTVTACGKNILVLDDNLTTVTTNGVTFEPQSDGGIYVHGTSTAWTTYKVIDPIGRTLAEYNGYVLSASGMPESDDVQVFIQLQVSPWTKYCSVSRAQDATIDFGADLNTDRKALVIYLEQDVTVDTVIYPMIRPTGTSAAYVPHAEHTIPVSTGLPLRAVGDVKDVIDFSAGAVITRIANDGETVLSQPVVTQLSAAELQAWRNFRTADGVTHISATDNPVMDVIYINNTGNGEAVARVQDVEGSVYRTLYFNDYATTQAQSITLSESYKNFEELEITLLRISDSGTRVSPRVFTIPVEALVNAGTTTMLPVLTATYWSSEYIQYSITNDTTFTFVGTSSGTNSTLVIAKIVGVGADAVQKQVIGGVDVDKAYVDAGLATKVDKNGTDRLMTAAEGTKLGGIATGATANTVFDTTVTLAAADWVTYASTHGGTEMEFDYHKQTVNVANILSTDTPILDVVISSVWGEAAQQRIDQWGYIGVAYTGDGTISFYCYNENKKPTVDLTVSVKVVR